MHRPDTGTIVFTGARGRQRRTLRRQRRSCGLSGLAAAHLSPRTAERAAAFCLDNHNDFGAHAKRNVLIVGTDRRLLAQALAQAPLLSRRGAIKIVEIEIGAVDYIP